MSTKIKYVCLECGSPDIEIENWNRWDIEKQEWTYVSEAGTDWWCPKCETHSVNVDEQEIK